MPSEINERGARIRKAMSMRGRSKALALATELGVSEPAVSRWIHGNSISLENACKLAVVLDTSLDWLALGRCTPNWHKDTRMSDFELRFIDMLRGRPARIRKLFQELLEEIPETKVNQP